MGARVFLSFDYFLSNILKIFLVCNYGPFYWLTKSKLIEKTADLPQGLCYIKFYYIHVHVHFVMGSPTYKDYLL